MMKRRVLFLCTGNSARSQMAEAWLRRVAGDHFEVASAGTEPRDEVHPLAVRAMAEARADITAQRPKDLARFVGEPWDFVITLCDRAKENCPTFPWAEQMHWSFLDPAAVEGSEAERLTVFSRVRDEILTRVRLFAAAQTRARI